MAPSWSLPTPMEIAGIFFSRAADAP
ncbi:hypothetical protein ACNVD4_06665 [Rhizobium sp. BR5]